MFAMYNRAVIVAMLGKALPYLGLHAVLSPETMVISLPNAINSRRSWQGYGRSGSTVLPASVSRCSSASIETKVYCYRNCTATERSPIVALKVLWLVCVGWRMRGATNPFGGQVATRLLRGYNIDTTATLLT